MRKFLFIFLMFNIFSFSANINIPSSIINNGISKVFPIEKSNKFSNISVEYVNSYIDSGKIFVEINYTASVLKKNLAGNIIVSSDVYYNEIEKKLFLKDVKIEEFNNNGANYNFEKNIALKYILNMVYSSIESKSILDINDITIAKSLNIKDIYILKNNLLIII